MFRDPFEYEVPVVSGQVQPPPTPTPSPTPPPPPDPPKQFPTDG